MTNEELKEEIYNKELQIKSLQSTLTNLEDDLNRFKLQLERNTTQPELPIEDGR